MKNAKVTKSTKMDKKDQHGNTSFVIEFDNGDKGFYVTKQENQTKFVPGSSADYEIEQKTGQKGNTYYKIRTHQTPDQQQTGSGKWSGSNYQKADPKVSMISFAMAYTKDLIVAGKIEMSELPTTFDIIFSEMIGKLDELSNLETKATEQPKAQPSATDDLPF